MKAILTENEGLKKQCGLLKERAEKAELDCTHAKDELKKMTEKCNATQ